MLRSYIYYIPNLKIEDYLFFSREKDCFCCFTCTKLRVHIQIQLFTTDTAITLSQLERNNEKLKRYRLIWFLFMKLECQKRNFIILEKHDLRVKKIAYISPK